MDRLIEQKHHQNNTIMTSTNYKSRNWFKIPLVLDTVCFLFIFVLLLVRNVQKQTYTLIKRAHIFVTIFTFFKLNPLKFFQLLMAGATATWRQTCRVEINTTHKYCSERCKIPYAVCIVKKITRWRLNQPKWKICSSNWIISPGRGKHEKKWNHHLDK